MYLRDTGLLHHLLGIGSKVELDVHPARGATWESFVLGQILSLTEDVAAGTASYYWRTATGQEVDLLLDFGGRLEPIEIKLHTSPTAADADGLRHCMTDLRLDRGWLVHAGAETYSLGGGVTAVAITDALERPGPWLGARRPRLRRSV